MKRITVLAMTILLLVPHLVEARVTEMVVTNIESPTFGGRDFGGVGKYERLEGVIKGEVDPKNPLNAAIVNIDRAPVNEKGFVEYDVDFTILKPIDMKKGNGRVLYDTVNRGRMLALGTFNNAPRGSDTSAAKSAGNGFLMRKGYTIVASGWQNDYPEGLLPRPISFFVGLGSRLPLPNKSLMSRFPIAKNEDGSSIVGRSREEYYDPPFNRPGPDNTLIKNLTYPAANLDPTQASLTVRAHEKDMKQSPRDMIWEYVDEWRIKVEVPSGYDQGAIYEFVYPAKDPIVYGLGYASIRDVVSFMRYEDKDDKGNRNPLYPEGGQPIKKALAYGASQTGRLIKTFVYEGFNESEKGRIVFDGINSHIGASRKNWLNGEFSHPGDIFGNDQFPFSYAKATDHVTGETDGLLVKCQQSGTCPKVMQTDTETEIWSSAASLVVTDTKGHADVTLPENVRAYMFTGARHGSGGSTKKGFCQQMGNPLDYALLSRAILVALDHWATYNVAPPESRYPSLSDGTFVSVEQARAEFPNIPGVTYNGLHLQANHLDYSVQPPKQLGTYPIHVMKVDDGGNGVAGIRLPAIQVPIATYTGWNLTAEGFGGDDRLCTASGSYIPFARTKAERLASGDPRLSVKERYPTHADYVKAVTQAAIELAQQRLLLWEDVEAIIRKADESDIGN